MGVYNEGFHLPFPNSVSPLVGILSIHPHTTNLHILCFDIGIIVLIPYISVDDSSLMTWTCLIWVFETNYGIKSTQELVNSMMHTILGLSCWMH